MANINHDEAKEDDNLEATDNAISAMGRIALHQSRPELFVPWLTYLPLHSDAAEAEVCYGMLCDLVEGNNASLLGTNFANLPRILVVMCDILHRDHKHMVTDTVRNRITTIMHRLTTLPAEAIAALNASLTPLQRHTFADVIAKQPQL